MAASTQEPRHSHALRLKDSKQDNVVATFIREEFCEEIRLWAGDDVGSGSFLAFVDVGATKSEVLRAASPD